MTSELQQKLAAKFPSEEERTFEGRGGKTFTYIEDERVMDRLDEVGMRWQLRVEAVDVEQGIAKVRLSIYDGEWLHYEDFGYQTREGGEGLKEAVSDGIRRVGRMAGIGRYLYTRQDTPKPAPQRPQVVAATREDPGAAKPSQGLLKKLMASFDEKGLKNPELRKAFTITVTGKSSSKDLTVAEVEKLLVGLAAYIPAQ